MQHCTIFADDITRSAQVLRQLHWSTALWIIEADWIHSAFSDGSAAASDNSDSFDFKRSDWTNWLYQWNHNEEAFQRGIIDLSSGTEPFPKLDQRHNFQSHKRVSYTDGEDDGLLSDDYYEVNTVSSLGQWIEKLTQEYENDEDAVPTTSVPGFITTAVRGIVSLSGGTTVSTWFAMNPAFVHTA